MVTAVGGGVVRDVLLNRVPIILHKEIYALPALLAAAIQVMGQRMEWWENHFYHTQRCNNRARWSFTFFVFLRLLWMPLAVISAP